MTPSEAPKALQASECSELLDPTRANCWISAQHQPGKFTSLAHCFRAPPCEVNDCGPLLRPPIGTREPMQKQARIPSQTSTYTHTLPQEAHRKTKVKIVAVPSQLPCPKTSRHAETCTTCKSGSTKWNPHSRCVDRKCQYFAGRITIAEILCKYSRLGKAVPASIGLER
jgi:hypothetical protein